PGELARLMSGEPLHTRCDPLRFLSPTEPPNVGGPSDRTGKLPLSGLTVNARGRALVVHRPALVWQPSRSRRLRNHPLEPHREGSARRVRNGGSERRVARSTPSPRTRPLPASRGSGRVRAARGSGRSTGPTTP